MTKQYRKSYHKVNKKYKSHHKPKTHKKTYHSSRSLKLGKCSYHLCDRKRVEIFRCKHCNEYFCKEHLRARSPMGAPFKLTDVEKHIEWEKKGGHPCVTYVDYLAKKKQEDTKKLVHMPFGEIDELEDTEKEIKYEPPLKPEPELNIEEKEDERLSISDVKCYDCGKNLLYSNKEYFFDEDIEERITLCPECWGNRRQTGGKVKPTEDSIKPSKKITNYNKLIYGTVGFILIIILLFTLFSFYDTTVEAIDSYSDLSTLNSELQDAKDELDSVNSQINSAENQLFDVATEVLLLQSGNRYELHDPTYSEVISFLSTDTTNSNNYGSGYTCVFFSKDVNNNAEQQGIRCAYVELEFVDSGHALVAFETTDEDLVYFEPQHDVKANIQIGSRYYTCLAQLPGYLPWEAPGYDDTIESIIRFW